MHQQRQMQEIELKPSRVVHSSVLNKICTMQLLRTTNLYGIIIKLIKCICNYFQNHRTKHIAMKFLGGAQAGGSHFHSLFNDLQCCWYCYVNKSEI